MAYEAQFIEHLSKEIETHTNAIMSFRTKIAFTVFVGPFILLSSVLLSIEKLPTLPKCPSGLAGILASLRQPLLILLATYLLLGLISGLIEAHMWAQCNRWRRLIVWLSEREDVERRFNSATFQPHYLVGAYILSFGVLFVSFVAMFYIISRLLRLA